LTDQGGKYRFVARVFNSKVKSQNLNEILKEANAIFTFHF
jgi:hypothetical protein